MTVRWAAQGTSAPLLVQGAGSISSHSARCVLTECACSKIDLSLSLSLSDKTQDENAAAAADDDDCYFVG